MGPETLLALVHWFVPVLLSLTVHEWAHAASAAALGDDTASRQGRLTLNPIPHLDLFGSVILPIVQIVVGGGVMFAWAKPVPISPIKFRRTISMSMGSVIVSAAGPVSNLVIALGSIIGLGLAQRFGGVPPEATALMGAFFVVNVGLAMFNLIPLPPLDGSKVLHGLLPRTAALAYERIFPYAPFLLMGLVMFGGRLLAGPRDLVMGWFLRLGAVVAG